MRYEAYRRRGNDARAHHQDHNHNHNNHPAAAAQLLHELSQTSPALPAGDAGRSARRALCTRQHGEGGGGELHARTALG
eukprot:scaffold2188_cov388-Prasinococcus_capsulatus_cf.AAC.4